MNITRIFALVIFSVILNLTTGISFAQKKTTEPGAQELADKLSNPVSNIISVPFQNNTVWGIGPNNGVQNVLNFQPVIPLKITKGLSMINRIVLPIIAQFNVTGLGESQNALSDLQYSIFFAPKSSFIWGIGPIFSIPTATNTNTGSGKFSIGPTGVFLYKKTGLTIGVLLNQFWSVGGDPDRGNQTQAYLQPFISHSWKSGGGVSLTGEITQNWKVKRTQSYINVMFQGITKLGKLPVQLVVGPRIPLTALPELKGYFGIRAALVLVL
ncbi:MAG: hypothetical protein IPL53_22340 [Ignavibacteria bacterium]|nr:hypothetical protein [Ignavibacteria bacterium]